MANTTHRRRGDTSAAQLHRLVETAKRVSDSLDLDTVLTAIVADATALLDAASGDILLRERDRDVLRVVAVANFPPDMLGYEMRFGEGVSSQALLTHRTIQVDDYATYEHRAPRLDAYEFGAVLCAPLLFRGAAIGTINVHATDPRRRFEGADADLLQAFAGLAAIAIDHARRFQDLEERNRGDAIGELLTGSFASDATIAERFARLGADLRALRDVFVIDVGPGDLADERGRRIVRRIDEQLQRELPGSVVGPVGRSIVVLATARRPRHLRAARALANALVRTVRDTVGDATVSMAIGDPCTQAREFATSVALARETLDVMAALGHADLVITTTDLGVYRLLLRTSDPAELRAFAERALGPLAAYDARTGSDLIGTLGAYLAEDRHQARTAARLVVHVNTVAYRVRRIEELLERDLADPTAVFELTLANRIQELRRARQDP